MAEGRGRSRRNAPAIVAILLIVLLVAFLVFKSGNLGGGENSLDINFKAPTGNSTGG